MIGVGSARARILLVATAMSAATCTLFGDLDELSGGRSGSGDTAGAGGEAGSGSGNGGEAGRSDGGGATGAFGGAAASSSSASGTAGGTTNTASSTGSGCNQICQPASTLEVECNPCYRRIDTCAEDGCSYIQGNCDVFNCQRYQSCDLGYCCSPYQTPCASDNDCCPGAPYCEGMKCMGN